VDRESIDDAFEDISKKVTPKKRNVLRKKPKPTSISRVLSDSDDSDDTVDKKPKRIKTNTDKKYSSRP